MEKAIPLYKCIYTVNKNILDLICSIAYKCGKLTTLNISNDTALRELYCYGNQLTSLDLSDNIALTYLTCGNNQLTTLDVSNNTVLDTLQCRDNQLTTLDLTRNPSLNSGNIYFISELYSLVTLSNGSCPTNRLVIFNCGAINSPKILTSSSALALC